MTGKRTRSSFCRGRGSVSWNTAGRQAGKPIGTAARAAGEPMVERRRAGAR